MKKRNFVKWLFTVITICAMAITLSACNGCKNNIYDISTENYGEYLSVEGRITGEQVNKGWLYLYGMPMYQNPSVKIVVSPIDEDYHFEATSLTVSISYILYEWDRSSIGLDISKTKTEEVTLTIDENGTASKTIDSKIGKYGLTFTCLVKINDCWVTDASGRVTIPCLHEWQDDEIITPASCASHGTMSAHCKKCGKSKEKSIDALGHDFPTTPTSSTPATCTSAGSETYSCKRCGENETKTIDALGHTYNENDAIITPANCTNTGKVDYTCTRCGSVNSDVIDALGHSFTTYTTVAATCTNDSYKTAKCDRCEKIDTVNNEGTALGHSYGADGKCTRCSIINPNLKVTSLEISNDSFLLETGKATQVNYTVYPSDAIYEKVTYRIYQNNTCDATLTETGLLTCGKVGSVTVAVTIDDEITARATFYVPQMITTAEEFYNIRNDLSGIYMLANDIDLSEYTSWTPIGNATKSSSGNYDYTNAFSGKFDGGGHTISGLSINLSATSCSSLLTVGLFGSLSRDGQVSNVVLKDVKVTGTSNATDYVGMLVGFNPGIVNDCDVSGTMTISESTYIGGAIGENIGSAKKISSNVAITVTGSKNYLVGGITGRTTGGQLSDVSVLGSIDVTSSTSVYVGGVAGNLVDSLATASADVDITVKTTSANSTYNYVGIIAGASSQSLSGFTVDGSITINSYGNSYVGGIVGYSDASISKCINDAVINLTISNSGSISSYVGGVIGCTPERIDDCTNNGVVSAKQFYGGYVGGIAGNAGAVSNCKNNADVYAKSTSKTVYCGGVAGNASSVSSSNNNAKVNTLVDVNVANYVGGIVGYSEGTVSNCNNNEKGELVIRYSSSTSSSSTNQYFGGIIGYGKSTVSDSTNYANVSAFSNGVVYCGGVLGYANGNVSKVSNYGYSMSITSAGTNSNTANYIGGVAGYINGTLTEAYNTATVSVTKGNVAVGGVAGYVKGSTATAQSTANIKVNNTYSEQSLVTYVGGVVGNTPSSVASSAATNSNIEVNSKNKLYVGGIVGNCGETITECYAYPNITVDNGYITYIGGVSGYTKQIAKSYSTSNILGNTIGSSDLYAGGLSGYISAGAEESYATGDISGTASSNVHMAGLIGYVGNGANVTNCYASNGYIKTNSSSFSSTLQIIIYNGGLVGYNNGTISYSYAVNYGYSISYGSSNSHSHYIGGLVAHNNGTIFSSYVLDATDKLARANLEINRDVVGSGTAKSFYAGGFVGYNQGNVSNCYSDATVNTTVSGAYTGGFVGFNNATINNSIAYGEVNSGITGDTTGGFAGGGTSGYTSCFFSKDTTLQTTSVGASTQSGITASTNANLRTASTFSVFDSAYWNIVDGTYPALIFGSAWESRSDGFNKYNMLINVPNKDNQYQFPHENRVTISFECNGGEEVESIVANKGSTIVLPALSDYEKDGAKYVFSGWCTDSECLNSVEGKIIKVTDSQKYYAYYRQAVAKPETTKYTYTGDKISVEDVYKTNDFYTASGTFDATVVGEYKVVLKLTHWYCWDDSTASDYEIVWEIIPYVVDIPKIYNSGKYVFYIDEDRDLSSEFGSDLYTTSGDLIVSKLDLDKHSLKFNLKDTKNYIWSDSTITEKAFEYYVATGVCNADNSTVAYWIKDGTLTIIGEGNMADYSHRLAPWNSRISEIVNVVILSGVTSIGDYSFLGCSELTSVAIPDSVTSIGNSAFKNCYRLVEVCNKSSLTITAGSSDNGYVAYYAKDVYAQVEGSKLTIDSNGFIVYDGNTLVGYIGIQTELVVPNEITVINNYAFYNCSSLTSVTIPDSVTSIGSDAFSGCSSLESITLPFVGDSVKTSSDTYQCPLGYIFGTSSYTGGVATQQYYYGSSTSYTTNTTYYIPSSLKSVTITGGNILYGAFRNCSGLTSITIPDSVTSIGSGAFNGCSSLTSVTIPDSVTSIGNYAFEDCSGLTSVTIPDSVTSIGNYAFEDCSGLTSVTIPDSVTSIGSGAFNGCSSLTSVTIPDSVTSIGSGAFNGCSSLTSITIPDSVTSIGSSAFSGCSSLESITLPFVGDSVKTSSDTYQYPFGYIFGKNSYAGGVATTQYYYGASTSNSTSTTYYIPSSLKIVTITGGNILYGAFRNCSGLMSVTIPDGVTSIGESAFCKCSGLTSITIPDSVTSIGESAFDNCSGLTSVTIPDSVTSIGESAFCKCSGLTSITIPDSVTSIGESAFEGCNGLTSVTISNRVTSIGNNAFYGCSGLASITIPDSVTTIGSSALGGCSKLTSIILPFIGDSKKTSSSTYQYPLGYIFGTSLYTGGTATNQYYYGSSTSSTTNTTYYIPTTLKEVTVTGGDILHGAFYNCSKLIRVTIGGNVTSIRSYAFSGCSSLESITLPFIGDSVKNSSDTYQYPLGYIFGRDSYVGGTATKQYYYDSSTSSTTNTTYYIPTTLKEVTVTGGNILYGAFDNCSGLTSVTIPDSVTSIGSNAFYNCSGLTSITIPDSVTTIGDSAFWYCRGLTSVTIPDSVTTIGVSAFRDCSGLTSLTISDSVTSIGSVAFYGTAYYNNSNNWVNNVLYIGKYLIKAQTSISGAYSIKQGTLTIANAAFVGCSGLTSVTIPDSVTTIGSSAFGGCSKLTSIILPFIGDSKKTSSDTYQYPLGYIFGTSNYTGGTATEQYYYGSSTSSITNTTYYIPTTLKKVTVTGGDILHGAFEDCSGLTSVTIGNGVTSIGGSAFYNCSSLTSVTIPDSVTSIGSSAFYNCSGLTSVTIGNGVTSIGGSAFDGTAYYNNSSNWVNNVLYIGKYLIKARDRAGAYSIEQGTLTIANSAFSGCSRLTNIIIPDSVITIGDYAFYDCGGLTSITIPDSVTSIGSNAFYNCSGLTSITVGEDNPNFASQDGILLNREKTQFIHIPKSIQGAVSIPDGVTTIGDRAFSGCGGLTSVTIPNSVTAIGDSAFYGCSGLTSITIPDSVTSIGSSAFRGCSGLTSVAIGDNVTSIGSSAFYNCSGLTSVTIGNGVTSIGGSAFDGTAYYNNSSNWVNNVLYIGKYLIKARDRAGAYSIEQGTLTIANSAFSGCSRLTNIIIPDSVITIGDYAFYDCGGLTSITIPDSVISIGEYVFAECDRLTSVTIGDEITSIGNYAFNNCWRLTSVIFKNTDDWWVSKISAATSGTSVTVADPTTAAKYLISFDYYCSYYWKRS